MAPENYTQMIMQLEQQQQEIGQMLAHMKALKAEMDKKRQAALSCTVHAFVKFRCQYCCLIFRETRNKRLVIGG